MSIKLSNKDYIWGYIGVAFSLGANLFLLPFVVFFLDSDTLGLWYVFQNLSSITVLFDFGFSVTFSRNINYAWNGAKKLKRTGAVFAESDDPNYALMKNAIEACRYVFLFISAIAFFLLLTLGTVYIRHISLNIISSRIVFPAWGICIVAVFLNLYWGYYGAFLKGVGAVSYANKSMVYARIIQIITTLLFLAAGAGLIGTSLAYLIYGFLYRVLARRFFYKYKGIGDKLKEYNKKTDKKEIRNIFSIVWHNAWREGIISVSNYLANQASTIICSLYMPLYQTGIYSLAVQLITAVSQLSMVIYSVNQPVLQSNYIAGDKEKMRRTMSFVVFSYISLYICGVIAVILVVLPFLRLIKPEMGASTLMILGVSMYQFVLNYRNCYGSYFSCTNRLPYVRAYIISAFAGIVLSVIAMKYMKMGVWGLIFSQFISQIVYNGWIWSLKSHRELELSLRDDYCLGKKEFASFIKKTIKTLYKQ